MSSKNSIDQSGINNGTGKSRFFLSRGSSFKQMGEDLLSLNSFKLNKTSKPRTDLDSQSEMGLKISNYKLLPSLGSFIRRGRDKTRSNSINLNSTKSTDDNIHIDGVMLFHSHSMGVCVTLTVTKKNILLQIPNTESQTEKKSLSPDNKEFVVLKKSNLVPKSPISKENDSSLYEIDLLNVGHINKEISNQNLEVIIYCRNFQHFKLLMKQSTEADLFIEKMICLSKGIIDSSYSSHPCLWHYLYNTYPFSKMSEWLHNEKWYFENSRIRFSIFNEIGQCETLPMSVIVPNSISDSRLDQMMAMSNGHRVPVVSFLYRKSGYVLIRSTSFHETTLQTLLLGIGTPIRELDINSIMPPLEDIEKYYGKLRNACFTVVNRYNSTDLPTFNDINISKRFMCKCGPWLNLVSKVLKFTLNLVNIIKKEASVGLVELFDKNWNCVLSSLVQIMIDPDRRTISGFESLISKEWVYLIGYKSRSESRNNSRKLFIPNDFVFYLFIDCVHQLISQNPTFFEFSSFYLITLVDSQFTSETYTREKAKQLEANKEHIINFNPFYHHSEYEPTLRANITDLRLFYGLLFRQLKSGINIYTPEEILFLRQPVVMK